MQHFFDPPDNAIDRYAAEPTFPSVLSRLNAASLQFPGGYFLDNFTVNLDTGYFTRTYDVAGTTLLIQMIPDDSNNQAIIGIFGN